MQWTKFKDEYQDDEKRISLILKKLEEEMSSMAAKIATKTAEITQMHALGGFAKDECE